MEKKNLIRFVESLVFLPALTMSMSLPGVPNMDSQNVLAQKVNIESIGALALNQAVDPKDNPENEILKAKAEAIDAYFALHDMPLEGMGMKMVEEAEKNEIDWRLLPAIAIRESTGGKHDCKRVENNPFGWGSCKIGFESNEEAIEVVAKNLGGNNPKTAKHYSDKTTKEILQTYNPPSVVRKYADQVISIMGKIGEENMALTSAPNSSASA